MIDRLLDNGTDFVSFIPFFCARIVPGDILKIRPDGRPERKTFEYSQYYGRGWWEYDSFLSITFGRKKKSYKQSDYIDDLKSVATFYGYTADRIDALINEGFTLEEIEECLYYV